MLTLGYEPQCGLFLAFASTTILWYGDKDRQPVLVEDADSGDMVPLTKLASEVYTAAFSFVTAITLPFVFEDEWL